MKIQNNFLHINEKLVGRRLQVECIREFCWKSGEKTDKLILNESFLQKSLFSNEVFLFQFKLKHWSLLINKKNRKRRKIK